MNRSLEARVAKLERSAPVLEEELTTEEIEERLEQLHAARWPDGASYEQLREYAEEMRRSSDTLARVAVDDIISHDGVPPACLKGPVPQETANRWARKVRRAHIKQLRQEAFAAARAAGWEHRGLWLCRWNEWIYLPQEFVPEELWNARPEDVL